MPGICIRQTSPWLQVYLRLSDIYLVVSLAAAVASEYVKARFLGHSMDEPETLKWRCGICRDEFVTENPPKYLESAQMQLHVTTHKTSESLSVIPTEQTKEEIEIAILELVRPGRPEMTYRSRSNESIR